MRSRSRALSAGLSLGGQQGLAVEFCDAGVRGRYAAGAGAHDGPGQGALLALGRGLQHEHAVAQRDGRIQSFSHREVDGAGLGGGHGKPSVWVTVSRWPCRASLKMVSEEALMTRSRTFCPGLAVRVRGAAGTRPLTR